MLDERGGIFVPEFLAGVVWEFERAMVGYREGYSEPEAGGKCRIESEESGIKYPVCLVVGGVRSSGFSLQWMVAEEISARVERATQAAA